MTILENIELKNHTTFKIGGKARFFTEIKSEVELVEAVDFAQNKNLPIFVLGGGSNVLISDGGFLGLVVKMEMKGICSEEPRDKSHEIRVEEKNHGSYLVSHNSVLVTAQAGENWDSVVKEMVERGLYGLENLSGIPGTVGASPVQNIGAYGSEVKDFIVKARVFDTKEKKFRELTNIECSFGYRVSIFKKPKYKHLIITSVTFALSKNGKVNTEYKDLTTFFATKKVVRPTLLEVRNAVIEIRNGKFPDLKIIGTAGSFWKNPIIPEAKFLELKSKFPLLPVFMIYDSRSMIRDYKVPLAWLLDNICGLKGYKKGKISLFKNQPLVLVTEKGVKSSEIKEFAEEIEKSVFEKTGISIEREVVFLD